MVYIPYPRTDLNAHDHLEQWRQKTEKKDGDWKLLKEYLADSARIVPGKHPLSKCWYSEMPQGDDYARDVEHFRPKNQASPLTTKQIKEINKAGGITFEQGNESGAYPWLEFDYRNYRIVSAITNRGGAKHIYFPIASSTRRLADNEYPWSENEFPYFLDPTSQHDTSLLFVKPNGEIAPLAPKTQLTQTDFNNLPHSWQQNGFNYLRAVVTIQLYRLNEPVFVKGRKEVYDKIGRQLEHLILCIDTGAASTLRKRIIEDIIEAALPSAPFSLAAKSALTAFAAPDGATPSVATAIKNICRQILNKIQLQVEALQTDWNRP